VTTPTGTLASPLRFHTATVLPSGKVFIAGGVDSGTGTTQSATYVFDPSDQSLTPGPNLSVARESHTATLLAGGKVLIAGGRTSGAPYVVQKSADIYDPSTGMISMAAPMNGARFGHEATLLQTPLLQNGKVLVAGGSTATDNTIGSLLGTAEIYDPTADSWTVVATGLTDARRSFTITTLNDGWPLAAGGFGNAPNPQLTSSETFDAGAGMFDVNGSMATGRAWHRATVMPDGRVLVTGGLAGGGSPLPTKSAELFNGPPD
jgi:hypothetical protein